MRRGAQPSRGSRSAASTRRTWRRSRRRARGAWSSCGRSATPRIRRRRRPRCGPRSRAGRALGRRSRRREHEAAAPSRPPSRSEARNAAAREALVPLHEGERPTAVTVGAVVAAALGVANVVVWLAGAKIGHRRPAAPGVLSYSILMGIAAWGMWKSKYWAVLGMEAIL